MSFAGVTQHLRCSSTFNFENSATSLHGSLGASWIQWRMTSCQRQNCKVIAVRVACQESSNSSHTQSRNLRHRPGRSKHHYHFFKRTGQSETGTKAAKLVEIVTPLSNVKEEIYAALDEWLAFEVEFPKIALAKALKRLKEQEQWLRIIQVSKWMWSKGHGKSIETYGLMLKAYERDSRLEECSILWEKILAVYAKSMPKSMFVRMLQIYKRQQMPGELVKVFEQMESLKIRPATDTLEMIKEAYKQIGRAEMENVLIAKYPPRWKYLHYRGRSVKVRMKAASTASEPGETDEGCMDLLERTPETVSTES